VGSASSRNEYQDLSLGGGGEGGRRVRLTTLSSSVSRCPEKMRESGCLTSLWAFVACYRDSFTLFYGTNEKYKKSDNLGIYIYGKVKLIGS
jgi:hypothetical protein